MTAPDSARCVENPPMSKVTEQYREACGYLAGGVSASTRLNRALGHPLLIDRAKGCRVWDLDGREYIDLCCSHGATLLGHGDPRVPGRGGIGPGARGGVLVRKRDAHPVRTLAVRNHPLLRAGALHRLGHRGDPALPAAGPGVHRQDPAAQVRGQLPRLSRSGDVRHRHAGRPARPRDCTTLYPGSSGLPEGLDRNLVVVPYNRPDLLETAFRKHGHELAAVICEPIYYNAGCIVPTPEFLAALRGLTAKHGVLLIFDEVLSAFRMAPGGAQEYLGVTPDLCTLGKAVGGGFPLSVFGGRREIMDRLMPTGDCQHSGTYNGHPVAVAAGLAAVTAYRQRGVLRPHPRRRPASCMTD